MIGVRCGIAIPGDDMMAAIANQKSFRHGVSRQIAEPGRSFGSLPSRVGRHYLHQNQGEHPKQKGKMRAEIG